MNMEYQSKHSDMRTVFKYKKKKLFEVQHLVMLDNGDIVEHEIRGNYANLVPESLTKYKVVRRTFRNEHAFSGVLEIELVKIKK